jgi:RNA-directed DNA polymerase
VRSRAHILPQSETRWSAPLPELKKNSDVERYVARALLAGGWRVDDLTTRVVDTLGREPGWIEPLVRRYVARFEAGTRPRLGEVVQFLADDARFRAAMRRSGGRHAAQLIAGPQPMLPVEAAAGWGVPAIEAGAQLAEWLRLSQEELEWFADLKNLQRKASSAGALRHYHFRFFEKKSGGARLIESPKARLKALQRKILAEILNRVPAHPAAHGFVRGRSIRTFAEPHTGRVAVLRMDLKDFFPSVRRARVQALFRTLGYPEMVADLLGGLVTTRTPRDVLSGFKGDGLADLRRMYEQSHLPQGAPTSPTLANACCWRLDCRLAGLAEAAGAAYTRYADDVAFSGDAGFARGVMRFAAHVGAIVLEEGLAVNFRKTRVMRQGVRQHLAGLVVNERVNTGREEFDRLKAILSNCVRNGPAGENRDGRQDFRAHLEGRVAFVASVNAARGARLRKLFEQIDWA